MIMHKRSQKRRWHKAFDTVNIFKWIIGGQKMFYRGKNWFDLGKKFSPMQIMTLFCRVRQFFMFVFLLYISVATL